MSSIKISNLPQGSLPEGGDANTYVLGIQNGNSVRISSNSFSHTAAFASANLIPANYDGIARVETDLYMGDGSKIVCLSRPNGLKPYLGSVATNCKNADQYFSGFWFAMTRTAHSACEDLTRFKVIFPTWYNDYGVGEGSLHGTVTLEATLEYPLGTFTRMTFSGVNKGSVVGGTNFETDFINITIPNSAMFWIRSRLIIPDAAPVGTVTESGTGLGIGGFGISNQPGYGSTSNAGSAGECSIFQTDWTETPENYLFTAGTFGDLTATLLYRPCAIVAYTTKPTFYICGDSISMGSGDTVDSTLRAGHIDRSTRYATLNVGIGGESFANLIAAPKRRDLSKYCSHVVCNYGINQVASGATAWATDATTLLNLFPNKIFYYCTLLPQQATTSNAWVDGGNSTAPTNETNRLAINKKIRTQGVVGMAGFIDFDYVMATTFNGPYWKPSMTSDGTHPNQYGYSFLSGNIKFPII